MALLGMAPLGRGVGGWLRVWTALNARFPVGALLGSIAINAALLVAFVASSRSDGLRSPRVQAVRPIEVNLVIETAEPDLAPAAINPKPNAPPTTRPSTTRPPAMAPEVETIPQKARKGQGDDRRPDVSSAANGSVGGLVMDLPADDGTGAPLGLRGLLETDPCDVPDPLRASRGDCDLRWSDRLQQGTQAVGPSMEELAAMYPDTPSPFRRGGPEESAKARFSQATGGRVMGATGPLPGGAASLGGVHDLTGRLPPIHPDPGFGD